MNIQGADVEEEFGEMIGIINQIEQITHLRPVTVNWSEATASTDTTARWFSTLGYWCILAELNRDCHE